MSKIYSANGWNVKVAQALLNDIRAILGDF